MCDGAIGRGAVASNYGIEAVSFDAGQQVEDCGTADLVDEFFDPLPCTWRCQGRPRRRDQRPETSFNCRSFLLPPQCPLNVGNVGAGQLRRVDQSRLDKLDAPGVQIGTDVRPLRRRQPGVRQVSAADGGWTGGFAFRRYLTLANIALASSKGAVVYGGRRFRRRFLPPSAGRPAARKGFWARAQNSCCRPPLRLGASANEREFIDSRALEHPIESAQCCHCFSGVELIVATG